MVKKAIKEGGCSPLHPRQGRAAKPSSASKRYRLVFTARKFTSAKLYFRAKAAMPPRMKGAPLK